MTARASMLPVLQYCGYVAELAERFPVGLRASLKGTYLHAVISRDPKAAVLRERLTDEEKAEVDGAVAPTPLIFEAEGWAIPPLMWEDGEQEWGFGMSKGGALVPEKEATLYTGHIDNLWNVKPLSLAVIADLKTGSSTAPGGAMSLQLVAYGFAAAEKLRARYFATAVWYSHRERGYWAFGDIVDTQSEYGLELWHRVVAAATAERTAIKGEHCLEACFNRANCGHWLLPDMPKLEALQKPEPTSEELSAAIVEYESLKELTKKAEAILKAHAKDKGGIQGKRGVWGPVECQGKSGIDKAALERDGLLEKYTGKGEPYTMYTWRKK